MKTFNVYRHPERGVVTRKSGFCWPALFFNVLWMLTGELWLQASVWFLALASLPVLEQWVYSAGMSPAANALSVLYVPLVVVPGLFGNRWMERKLIKDGYRKAGSFEASVPVVPREAIKV